MTNIYKQAMGNISKRLNSSSKIKTKEEISEEYNKIIDGIREKVCVFFGVNVEEDKVHLFELKTILRLYIFIESDVLKKEKFEELNEELTQIQDNLSKGLYSESLIKENSSEINNGIIDLKAYITNVISINNKKN